jgi:hypothetical protein
MSFFAGNTIEKFPMRVKEKEITTEVVSDRIAHLRFYRDIV